MLADRSRKFQWVWLVVLCSVHWLTLYLGWLVAGESVVPFVDLLCRVLICCAVCWSVVPAVCWSVVPCVDLLCQVLIYCAICWSVVPSVDLLCCVLICCAVCWSVVPSVDLLCRVLLQCPMSREIRASSAWGWVCFLPVVFKSNRIITKVLFLN